MPDIYSEFDPAGVIYKQVHDGVLLALRRGYARTLEDDFKHEFGSIYGKGTRKHLNVSGHCTADGIVNVENTFVASGIFEIINGNVAIGH